MRRTDSNILHGVTGLMRSVSALLQSAMRLMAVAVLLLVVSCSGGGDDPDSPGGGSPGGGSPGTDTSATIAFSAIQQEEQSVTRSTQPLEDKDVHTFLVWGYKNTSYSNSNYGGLQAVMPGYFVNWEANSANTTTSNTNDWEYVSQQLSGQPEQTIKYWDWSANAYRFFGLTHSRKVDVKEYPTDNPEYCQVSFTADATDPETCRYYSRLWFSTGNPSDYPSRLFGKPVKLEFLKPFAKVRFIFVPADAGVTLADLHIQDTSFGPTNGQGIALKGTFTVVYPLTGTGTSETWSVTPGTDAGDMIPLFDKAYTDDNQQWYTVLPAVVQGAFKLTMTVNGDPDKGCTIPAEYMDWLPGYSYTYVFKVSEEGGVNLGEVLTAYTDWKTGSDGEHTIYNW